MGTTSGGATGGADGATSTPVGGAMTTRGGTIVTSSARTGTAAAINVTPNTPASRSGSALLKNRNAEQLMILSFMIEPNCMAQWPSTSESSVPISAFCSGFGIQAMFSTCY